ncbi:MAG: chemotaxis protein CheD [Hyphomicrobiales bacterium]|nr:chemotaxis protein CheD [Hyphomicrobiales bacterium]MBV8663510.1 chemotaxis protein CheD [Hyphomicrobiales bacterium]
MNLGGGLERKIPIVQGEYRVSADPNVVVTTLLGSCVAACIRDPVAGVGGMNHFLLPGEESRNYGQDAERYGDYLMELLINGLMTQGAQRERLEAKLFGGARMMRGLSDIGRKNAEFAEKYLRHEGITVVGKDLGGERGRRLQYWPVSGRARQSYVAVGAGVEAVDVVRPQAPPRSGDVELF